MSDEPNYSKRELDHFLNDLKSHLRRQDEVLARIEGNFIPEINNIKRDIAELQWWRGSLKWAWGVLISVLLFLANKFL